MTTKRKKKKLLTKPPISVSKPSNQDEVKPRFLRITQWCVGTIFGVLILAVIGNHISSVIPNPFQYIFSLVSNASQKKATVWFAAGVKNEMKHEVSIGIWRDEDGSWLVDTLQPEQTKWYTENAPIYLTIQGDMVAQQSPQIRITHTYEGEEAYELETVTLDHEPSNNELEQIKPNKIIEILGGPSPKTIHFVDGTKVTFDVFGQKGAKLKTFMPVMYEGKSTYQFEVSKPIN